VAYKYVTGRLLRRRKIGNQEVPPGPFDMAAMSKEEEESGWYREAKEKEKPFAASKIASPLRCPLGVIKYSAQQRSHRNRPVSLKKRKGEDNSPLHGEWHR